MDCTSPWLPAAIADLAAIDDEGRLEQLVTDHANESRRLGLPNDNELHLPDADFQSRRLARYAAQLFGVPIGQCEAVAREAFRRHPRRDVALELIGWYRGRDDAEQEPPAVAGKVGQQHHRRQRRRVI